MVNYLSSIERKRGMKDIFRITQSYAVFVSLVLNLFHTKDLKKRYILLLCVILHVERDIEYLTVVNISVLEPKGQHMNDLALWSFDQPWRSYSYCGYHKSYNVMEPIKLTERNY